MKASRLLLFVGLSIISFSSQSQSIKNIVFKSYKSRDLQNNVVNREQPVDATITVDSTKIILAATIKGKSAVMECEIQEIAFNDWKAFLKNGKVWYKVLAKREVKEKMTIKIESTNGNTTITFSGDPDDGSSLQFDIAEYEIAKT